MRKILVLFAIVLGLAGCTMNVPTNVVPQVELPQNKVEWISNNRAATTTLDYVTIEIYKVPTKDGKFIYDEKEYVESKALHRGEVLTFPSAKDYNYKYITAIRVIEFNCFNAFYATRDEINIFDYENTIGLEQVHYYACQLRTSNIEAYGDDAGHKIWRVNSKRIMYRDDLEGYENYYYFLNNKLDVIAKFYNEHKDGGLIEWNN